MLHEDDLLGEENESYIQPLPIPKSKKSVDAHGVRHFVEMPGFMMLSWTPDYSSATIECPYAVAEFK